MATPADKTRHPMEMRRQFLSGLASQIRLLWPIFSLILLMMFAIGFVIGRIEGWDLGDSVYFTFVTGLTIGYGDFTPTYLSTRLLALIIGFAGIVLTGMVAAITVHALHAVGRSEVLRGGFDSPAKIDQVKIANE